MSVSFSASSPYAGFFSADQQSSRHVMMIMATQSTNLATLAVSLSLMGLTKSNLGKAFDWPCFHLYTHVLDQSQLLGLKNDWFEPYVIPVSVGSKCQIQAVSDCSTR